jgi:hypothetical protein
MKRESIAVIAVVLALGAAAAHAEPTLTTAEEGYWKQAEIAAQAAHYRAAQSAHDDYSAHLYSFNP